ncbi:MAG: cytidine deaminase [Thermoplasmata archaeon]|nr:cytidine deaminase [Thermoplasmata archaeon]
MDPEKLMDLARKAMNDAYAPYSGFKVGAVVLTKSGKVFTGFNIENASYGLSICAEMVAIFKAISEKEDLGAIAIASKSGNSQPCGTCRQVMIEFNPNAEVYYLKNGKLVMTTASQLLPESFNAASLNNS